MGRMVVMKTFLKEILFEKKIQKVVEGMICWGGMGLHCKMIKTRFYNEMKSSKNMKATGAGRLVATDLGVPFLFVLSDVCLVNHLGSKIMGTGCDFV